jgi:hypothetical protein
MEHERAPRPAGAPWCRALLPLAIPLPCGLLWRIVVCLVLGAPCTAAADGEYAADFQLCVSATGTGSCPTCTQMHPTFASALASAALLPDVAGDRPSVRVCLAGGGAHVENLVVDNEDGSLGKPLAIDFQGHPLCPEPASPVSTPAISFRPRGGDPWTPSDALFRGSVDLREAGVCESGPRPGILALGDGPLFLGQSGAILGTSGYALRHEGTGDGVDGAASLAIQNWRIAACQGAAIQSRPFLLLNNTQIIGCDSDPASELDGQPGLVVFGDEATIEHSVLLGNTVNGRSGEGDALVVGALSRLEGSLIAGNALLGGAHLLRHGWVARAWQAEDGELTSGSGPYPFEGNVLAGNRELSGPPPGFDVQPFLDLPPPERPVDPRCVGDDLPFPDDPADWMGSASGGSGSLILVDRELGAPWDGEVLYARNFILDNDLGASPVIEVRGAISGGWFHVLQNSFAANARSSVLSASALLPDGGIVVARNLQLGDGPEGGGLLAAAGFPGSVIVTGNVAEDAPWVDPGMEAEHALLGPNLVGPGPAFLPAGWDSLLTPCERAAVLSPSLDADACAALAAQGHLLHCAAGPASHYVVDRATGSVPSLWQTAFFGAPSPLGATGWDEADVRAPLDAITGPPAWGDGDGFPNLVDCDNDDPDVVPFVPEFDGVTSQYCVEPEGSCYRCPDGVNPPPEPDDDDSGAIDDDDSAAVDDVDNGSEPPPVTTTIDDRTGCPQGCGVSWGDDGLEIVLGGLLPPVGILRRRRRWGHV